jgi:hypothetical protein
MLYNCIIAAMAGNIGIASLQAVAQTSCKLHAVETWSYSPAGSIILIEPAI